MPSKEDEAFGKAALERGFVTRSQFGDPLFRALLACAAACLLAAPSRAEQEKDEGPLRVLSADELELQEKRRAQPVLVCSPREVRLALSEDETRSVRLTVRNAGGRILRWLVVSAPAWAVPEERTGKLAFGEKQDLVLTINPERLKRRLTRGEIVIEAPGAKGSPVAISVILEVKRKPKPPEPKRPKPPELPGGPPLREGRRARFGVRAGVAMPGSGELRDYDSGALFGFYYCRARRDGGSLSYEIGFDVCASGESDEYETRPVGGRFDVLFAFGGRGGGARPYVLSGFTGFVEFVDDQLTGTEYTNYAGALDLGVGAALVGGRLDARLTYQVLLGSDNLKSMSLLSLAYGF